MEEILQSASLKEDDKCAIEVESENEDENDDGLSSKDSDDDDDKVEMIDGGHHEDLMEGDGELVDATDQVNHLSTTDDDSLNEGQCTVEDAVDDEDPVEFLKSLKVWGNADQIERELVKMPSTELAIDEVKCSRENRVVTLHPFSFDDLTNPKFLKAIKERGCEEIRHQFVRPEGEPDGWTGYLVLNFASVSSATKVADELKNFRDDVEVKIQLQGSWTSRFNVRKWKGQMRGKHRWCDGLLVIKNIGERTTENKLSSLFPGASILLHTDNAPASSTGGIKGYAYVVFGMKDDAEAALSKYNGKRIMLDGRRLLLIKYYNPEILQLPEGMLRLGERRLLLQNINELNDTIKNASRDTTPLQNKEKIFHDLIEKDNEIRKQIGLLVPSYDRLSKMNSLRQFSEREKAKILQRLLNPPPPPPPLQQQEAKKTEDNSEKKAGEKKKRRNRGRKSQERHQMIKAGISFLRPSSISGMRIPPPSIGVNMRSPLSVPPPSLRPSLPLPGSLPLTNLPPPLSRGNWPQPPPTGIPPPNTPPPVLPFSRQVLPVGRGPPPLPYSTSLFPPPTPDLLSPPPPRLPNMPPPPLSFNSPPPASQPQRNFPPPRNLMPPRMVPPPPTLVRPSSGILGEPPYKMTRYDNSATRPGLLATPKFRHGSTQSLPRRF